MANKKHIAIVFIASLLIVAGLTWWIDARNPDPELILEDQTEIQGPLAAEELVVNNPEITNTMNRIATFNTNKGPIAIELFEDQMPVTTGNFVKLVEEGFYNGTKFHRVINGFMIQGGDPNSKGDDTSIYGRGGPGYTIADEFIEGELLTNTRGTISMANTGQPNSGGSQFFINLVDNLTLDFDKEPFTSKHPVFGRVIAGLDVVDRIATVEVGAGDVPVEPVIIESVVISEQ